VRRRSLYVFSILAALVLVLTTGLGSALAFDCFPANKPTGAGSVGTVTFTDTGIDFDANKPNAIKGDIGPEAEFHGGFVTFALADGGTAEVFVHNILPPVRPDSPAYQGEESLCDGKGIDSLEACGINPFPPAP
jgi:hypothetical protein